MSIFSNLFGKRGNNRVKNEVARNKETNKRHRRNEPPNDLDLNSVEYVPLPPSPKTWEVDGRENFNRDYNDPLLKEIFRAGWQRKNTKVTDLAKDIGPEHLSGQAGQVVAKAYRDIILKRLKSNQIEPAARWSKEMFDIVPTHCTDTDRRRYNKILDKLDKANIRHEFTKIEVATTKDEPLFTLSEDSKWTLGEIVSIPEAERPDTSFKLTTFTVDGVLYSDLQGKSDLSTGKPACLRKLNRVGKVVAEQPLDHNIYRFGCGPTNKFCAIMDSDGKLHIYDESLSLVFEMDLQIDKRVKDHFKTTDTNYWGEFRSQIRAVDVSADGQCHLFTLADEAWCCDADNKTIWGVRMPLNEGWERVIRRSERTGSQVEIERALQTLGLDMPITPREIKQRFRVLALRFHPDRNPDDQSSHQRMQKINAAFEILTGVDPKSINIEVEESEVTYFRRKAPDDVIEVGPIRLEVWLPSGSAQDWIYAASFSARGSGAFLATYSGKVIEIDDTGVPLRVYDIGTIPDEIVDIGDYLYFLTPTRLYVLEQRDRLVALIDVFRQGKLIVTTTGFGLLDNKCFQWFTPSGHKIGEVTTRDPIRSLYDSNVGVILETRQHHTIISGLRLVETEGPNLL